MSYRPTISIYVQGHIADNGYYRNWEDEDLFYEAVALAALYSDCTSVEAYREKAFGTQEMVCEVESETFEVTEEDLRWREENSEFPIVVDLTAKSIYVMYGGMTQVELETLHTPDTAYTVEEYLRMVQMKAKHWPDWRGSIYRSMSDLEERCRRAEKCTEGLGERMNYSMVLEHFRIPLEHLDIGQVLEMYKNSEQLLNHCSEETAQRIMAA